MLHRIPLFIMAAAILGFALPQPAAAQYYNERPYDRYDRPHRGYDRPYRGEYRRYREYGRLCVTSRGTCATAPGPVGVSCRCHIPGFGKKRGSIE